MWIDLLNWRDGKEKPIHDVMLGVVARYDASLKAEMAEVASDTFSFRHAVCIVNASGEHFRRTPRIEELAGNLLTEYGAARGGTPSSWEVEKWNYGFCVGYAMSFIGGPTEPTSDTRLSGEPNLPGQSLRDREETFVYLTDEQMEGLVAGSAKLDAKFADKYDFKLPGTSSEEAP